MDDSGGGFHPQSRQFGTVQPVQPAGIGVGSFQDKKQGYHKQSFPLVLFLFVFVGEHLAQAHAGPVVQLLGVGHRDVEQSRDAPVRVSFDGVEVEDRPLLFRQLLDGFQQLLLCEVGGPNRFGVFVWAFSGGFRLQGDEIGLLSQVVDAVVHGDAGQPGIEAAEGAVGLEGFHCLQEHVLRQILRHRPVVDIAVADPDNPAVTPPVLLLPKFRLVHSILLPTACPPLTNH